jgi:predicted phage baseplate assembly protein
MALSREHLDDKTFDDFVKEAQARLPVYAPGWTDHNLHDPGITFIELFAWFAEMQLYRLNRITDRNYGKFLKLIGVSALTPATTATVEVEFTLTGPGPENIPEGTLVAAQDSVFKEDIQFETTAPLLIEDSRPQKFYTFLAKDGTYIDNTAANESEGAFFQIFGPDPASGDQLCIGFASALTGPLTMWFSLMDSVSKVDAAAVVFSSGSLVWEVHTAAGWAACEVSDGTKNFSWSGPVTVTIPGAMTKQMINGAELFWLRCRVEQAGYDAPPRVDRILFNTVAAVQRTGLQTYTFSSSGLPGFSVEVPAVPILGETLQVVVNGEDWNKDGNARVVDFDASKPGDKHLTADLTTGRITFGNGMQGKIPQPGKDNIKVICKSGGGTRGNVQPHTVARVIGSLSGRVGVDNEKAAAGGAEAETQEEAISRGRNDLKRVARAVTTQDFEYHALNTPGIKVARAKAVSGYHPSQDRSTPGIVTVIVVPDSPRPEPVPSTGFIKTVWRYLDAKRLLATELFVIAPQYVKVSVSAAVVIRPQYKTTTVAEKVGKALDAFLAPVRGGEDGAGWPFGRAVYLSEIYEVIDGVEGVNYVKAGTLVLTADGSVAPGDVAVPAHGLVCPAPHQITAGE